MINVSLQIVFSSSEKVNKNSSLFKGCQKKKQTVDRLSL